jgi:hypothetical protein
MTEFTLRFTIPAAFSLLPESMRSEKAAAMLLAIGLQESKFRHRAQIGGPALGFWQFEENGVRGVLRHAATSEPAFNALRSLSYSDAPIIFAVHKSLCHNDVLACAFARLLLWTLPSGLADRDQPERGWEQYLAAWRPGKPHPETWKSNFNRAWSLVRPDGTTAPEHL